MYQLIKKFECAGSVADAPQSDCPQSVRTDANRETVVLTFIENCKRTCKAVQRLCQKCIEAGKEHTEKKL